MVVSLFVQGFLENRSKDFPETWQEVRHQKSKQSDRAGFSEKIFVPEILGKKGSKKGFFGIFSKTSLTILFFFLQKQDYIGLH